MPGPVGGYSIPEGVLRQLEEVRVRVDVTLSRLLDPVQLVNVVFRINLVIYNKK